MTVGPTRLCLRCRQRAFNDWAQPCSHFLWLTLAHAVLIVIELTLPAISFTITHLKAASLRMEDCGTLGFVLSANTLTQKKHWQFCNVSPCNHNSFVVTDNMAPKARACNSLLLKLIKLNEEKTQEGMGSGVGEIVCTFVTFIHLCSILI